MILTTVCNDNVNCECHCIGYILTDMLVLVQPYSNATQYGNVRARPAMVEKLSCKYLNYFISLVVSITYCLKSALGHATCNEYAPFLRLISMGGQNFVYLE